MTSTAVPDLATLEREIERHIAASDAEFGLYLSHLDSGGEIAINAGALYPMASTFKIPILVETLKQIDEGKLSLATRIELQREDKVLPSGVLVELDDGLRLTLRDLLTLMIIISDNTATDMVLAQIGVDSVERRMREFGIEDIAFAMNIHDLFAATFDPPDVALLPWQRARDTLAQGEKWDAVTNTRSRQNNVASPRAMGRLLTGLLAGEFLSSRSTAVALDILLRQQLNQRIPRFLPPSVPVAHKTGTFIQTRNDAGIIELPDGGNLILVLFTYLRRDLLEGDPEVSAAYADRVDTAMGAIARTAYDAFAPGDQQ